MSHAPSRAWQFHVANTTELMLPFSVQSSYTTVRLSHCATKVENKSNVKTGGIENKKTAYN